MKKFFFLGAAAVLSAFTAFSQCDQGGTLFGDAPAPCSETPPVSVDIALFEVWRGDIYEITDVQAGASYTVDICQSALPGGGGTAWAASLTLVAPSGAIDAFGLDAGSICELSFTASESGVYQMFVNEDGECPGISQDIDNGSPRVTYTGGGICPDPITGCEAGVLDVASIPAAVCPNVSFPYDVTGVTIPNSPVAGSFRIFFDPVPGSGSAGPFAGGAFNLTFGDPPGEGINIGADIDNVLTTAGGAPALVGEWILTGYVSNGTFDCDSVPSVTIDFLTSADPSCVPVTTCEAGILDQAAIDNDLCPGESTNYAVTGATTPNSPLGGVYVLNFSPVPGSGAGGLAGGAAYNLAFTGIPPGTDSIDFNIDFDAELLLALGVAQVPMTGEWTITGGVTTDADPFDVAATFCDQVPSVVIDFLDENDPACGGPVPCELPYPAVDNASLNVVQNPNGSITFSWAPINGQIGCQVNARVGDPAAPTVQTSIIVGGAGASSFTASQFALAPYPFQNINFRVRCGCQQNPTTIAGPYSAFVSTVNVPPGASAISGMNHQSAKYPVVRSTNNVSIEALPMESWAPEYNAPNNMNGMVKVGSASTAAKASFDVFPNPTSGSVNLNYAATAEGMVNIRVFDLVGKAVADFSFAVNEGENFINLDLSSFEKGLYVVEVLEGGNSSTAKVVLK